MLKSLACTGVFLLFLLLNTAAMAAGIILYEVGTPDMGLASAGYAARAQDAATVLTNPAGMTRLDRSELMVGLQGLYGNIKFSPNADTTVSGGDGGVAVGFLPGGSAFYVNSFSENLKFGVGLYSNFGMSYDYDSDWVGRYKAKKGELMGLSLLPSVSYRLNEKFSIGASLNCMYGDYMDEVAVKNPTSDQDGKLKIEDDTFGFGVNLGVLFELSKHTRFGLTYTSEIDLDFEDTPEFTNIGPVMSEALNRIGLAGNDLDLDMTVPQTVMASFYHALNDRMAIMGNLGWQDWSEFGKIGIEIESENPGSITADRHYDDTWHAALGLQYRAGDPVMFSCGIAYDSSMVEEEYMTPDLPTSDMWRYGAGMNFQLKENIDLGCVYTLAWAGDMQMDQQAPLSGRVAGQYKNTSLHFLAFNVRWKF